MGKVSFSLTNLPSPSACPKRYYLSQIATKLVFFSSSCVVVQYKINKEERSSKQEKN
jgi:hypothetical protein